MLRAEHEGASEASGGKGWRCWSRSPRRGKLGGEGDAFLEFPQTALGWEFREFLSPSEREALQPILRFPVAISGNCADSREISTLVLGR